MLTRFLRICVVIVIFFPTSPISSYAGLELDNRHGEIVAIYRFSDASDSGPRRFNGDFSENAQVVRARGKNPALRLRSKGSFSSCCNDYHLALIGEFSIIAWVKLKPQTDGLNIVMQGRADNGALSGYASLLIRPNGNLSGVFANLGDDRTLGSHFALQSKRQNISDNKWHHIGFTGYGGVYQLFVDGEVVARRHIDTYVGFVSDKTDIYIANSRAKGTFNGNVFVDDAAFFELGFSVYEIRAIYRNGLTPFIKAMPVDPIGKIATTWGTLKGHRHWQD